MTWTASKASADKPQRLTNVADGGDDGHLLRHGPHEQDEGWEKKWKVKANNILDTSNIWTTNGTRKYVREDLMWFSTSGGRGGLIVNTASAAGLVFNQVAQYKYRHKYKFLYLFRKIVNQIFLSYFAIIPFTKIPYLHLANAIIKKYYYWNNLVLHIFCFSFSTCPEFVLCLQVAWWSVLSRSKTARYPTRIPTLLQNTGWLHILLAFEEIWHRSH